MTKDSFSEMVVAVHKQCIGPRWGRIRYKRGSAPKIIQNRLDNGAGPGPGRGPGKFENENFENETFEKKLLKTKILKTKILKTKICKTKSFKTTWDPWDPWAPQAPSQLTSLPALRYQRAPARKVLIINGYNCLGGHARVAQTREHFQASNVAFFA